MKKNTVYFLINSIKWAILKTKQKKISKFKSITNNWSEDFNKKNSIIARIDTKKSVVLLGSTFSDDSRKEKKKFRQGD